jgi:hypothetical protein
VRQRLHPPVGCVDATHPNGKNGPQFPAAGKFEAQRSPYVILTFQKTGTVNLRMPWTFLRKAVGQNHAPHGTYAASPRATFWISAASCLRFV